MVVLVYVVVVVLWWMCWLLFYGGCGGCCSKVVVRKVEKVCGWRRVSCGEDVKAAVFIKKTLKKWYVVVVMLHVVWMI